MSPKRSYVCSKEQLVFLRERRGWTQQQLADRAGYSIRLISKAENGSPISALAVREIAEALSDDEYQVALEDLTVDPLTLSKRFIFGLYELQAEAIDANLQWIDPDIMFHMAGDPKQIPFAGEHQGIDAVRDCLTLFFTILQPPEGHDPEPHYTFTAQGNDVFVWGESWIHAIGEPMEEPLKISVLMRYRRGRLILFDDRFDTLRGAQILGSRQN